MKNIGLKMHHWSENVKCISSDRNIVCNSSLTITQGFQTIREGCTERVDEVVKCMFYVSKLAI